jgi:hypothetical protein
VPVGGEIGVNRILVLVSIFFFSLSVVFFNAAAIHAPKTISEEYVIPAVRHVPTQTTALPIPVTGPTPYLLLEIQTQTAVPLIPITGGGSGLLIGIENVTAGTDVTISTAGFPPGMTLDVHMSPAGCDSADRIYVDEYTPGEEASLYTLAIPEIYRGVSRLAVCLSDADGFTFSRWFWNGPGENCTIFHVIAAPAGPDVLIHSRAYCLNDVDTMRLEIDKSLEYVQSGPEINYRWEASEPGPHLITVYVDEQGSNWLEESQSKSIEYEVNPASLTKIPTEPAVQPTTAAPPEQPVVIEAEYPDRLKIGQSDWIRVSLIRAGPAEYQLTVEAPKHTGILSTPMVIYGSTPAAPLTAAFGSDYTSCARAHLKGPAFEVEPPSQDCKSLDQPRIDWEWVIKPKPDSRAGEQVLSIRIDAEWRPDDPGRSTIQRELWRDHFTIVTKKPLIADFKVLGFVSIFIGSGCNIPFIYGVVEKKREKKKAEEKEKEQQKQKAEEKDPPRRSKRSAGKS